MSFDPYKALYIHIPFCKVRCNYCDFCTRARSFDSPEIDEYIEGLISEIRASSKEGKLAEIETIYIGGGTPTFIGQKRLSSLLYAISVSVNLENVKEFTIEANPDSVSEKLVKDIYALGVNRISIGIQSFNDDTLKMLGRIHDSLQAKEAISIAKERFENISLDLICGIPGQTGDNFKESLETAMSLDVSHMSIYPLSIEPNTVFYKWMAQGRIDKIDDDQQAEHMELSNKMLEDAGFIHYEIASFAKPGFESKHNLSYWTGKPYLGIGQSATTMTQNENRRMRVTDDHVEDDLDHRQMLAEDLMLGCRTIYGPSQELVKQCRNNFSSFEDVVGSLRESGLVEYSGDMLKPTKNGWFVANEIFEKLLNLA